MMATEFTRKPTASEIIDAYHARERAMRLGDGTTAHLLDIALRAALERRHMAQAMRRVLTRRHVVCS